jgi:hypothetical protein
MTWRWVYNLKHINTNELNKKKVKVSHIVPTWHFGGEEVQLHSFLTSAQEGGEYWIQDIEWLLCIGGNNNILDNFLQHDAQI